MIKSNQQKASDMLYIIQKSINQLIHMLQGADEEETKELTDELNQHVIIRSALLDILKEEQQEVTKIKRYEHDWYTPGSDGPLAFGELVENPDGDWVRWEDVQELLQKQEDNYAHETQLLTERINRLVSKND